MLQRGGRFVRAQAASLGNARPYSIRVVASPSSPRQTMMVGPRPRTVRTSPIVRRSYHSTARLSSSPSSSSPARGPTARYNELVGSKVLKDDDHQRSIVAILQNLHNELVSYNHTSPTGVLGAKPEVHKGLFSRLFGGGEKSAEEDHGPLKIPEDSPKGLYLFGDVGTGKR